jgi:hypothetical protein
MADMGRQETKGSGAKRAQQARGAGGHEAKRTRDHETIMKWAEERGGHPAVVQGTQILRIDFDEPGGNDDAKLERIPWDEFFKIFDDRGLEFLYQDRTADGKESRFNKFVKAGAEDEQKE